MDINVSVIKDPDNAFFCHVQFDYIAPQSFLASRNVLKNQPLTRLPSQSCSFTSQSFLSSLSSTSFKGPSICSPLFPKSAFLRSPFLELGFLPRTVFMPENIFPSHWYFFVISFNISLSTFPANSAWRILPFKLSHVKDNLLGTSLFFSPFSKLFRRLCYIARIGWLIKAYTAFNMVFTYCHALHTLLSTHSFKTVGFTETLFFCTKNVFYFVIMSNCDRM